MSRDLRIRGIVIAVVTALCVIIMFGPWNKPKGAKLTASDFYKPSNLKQNLSENIRLGLDLKGGTHLVMQVKVDEYIQKITDDNRDKAEAELKGTGIQFNSVKVPVNGQIVVETADTSKQNEIKDKILQDIGSDAWDVTTSSSPASVTFTLRKSSRRSISPRGHRTSQDNCRAAR